MWSNWIWQFAIDDRPYLCEIVTEKQDYAMQSGPVQNNFNWQSIR